MQKNIPGDVTILWNGIIQQLKTDVLEEITSTSDTEGFLHILEAKLGIDEKMKSHIANYSSNNPFEETVTGLLEVISLLEEKVRDQENTIQSVLLRLEKLEEENLQTRIEAAKHHLDSMEKLATLQHKLNAR